MSSMLDTIIPKSDQLNADDLIGGRSLTIKITKVLLAAVDQPVTMHYEQDNGKPYKPGKSMRRVLVNIWGPDANKYIGRSLTLYRDDKITFGGMNVGGLRISHMSDISEPVTLALTATRASRKPFTVKPLVAPASSNSSDIKTALNMAAGYGTIALETAFKTLLHTDKLIAKPFLDELKAIAAEVDARPKDEAGAE